jgi:hypothetical protein
MNDYIFLRAVGQLQKILSVGAEDLSSSKQLLHIHNPNRLVLSCAYLHEFYFLSNINLQLRKVLELKNY